jgi:hypothetical protein
LMGNGKQGAAAAKPMDAFKEIEKLEKISGKQRITHIILQNDAHKAHGLRS